MSSCSMNAFLAVCQDMPKIPNSHLDTVWRNVFLEEGISENIIHQSVLSVFHHQIRETIWRGGITRASVSLPRNHAPFCRWTWIVCLSADHPTGKGYSRNWCLSLRNYVWKWDRIHSENESVNRVCKSREINCRKTFISKYLYYS